MSCETSPRRFDPFHVLSPRERREHLQGYLDFLRSLDGELDMQQRTLSRRETGLAELEAKRVESGVALDLDAFYRNFSTRGDADLDRRTAWAVLAAKANKCEAYGVDRELSWIFASGAAERTDELHGRMLIQEAYHTRILHEVSRTVGVAGETSLPDLNQRWMIELIMRLPESLRWTVVLCGEVVGCEVFEALHANLDLFAGEPEVEERLRFLIEEILRDEILHVAYLRAKLGRAGLLVARTLLPRVAREAFADLPQLETLGTDRDTLLHRVGAGLPVPDDARWMQPGR